jgi:hypothetical protein
MSMQQIIEMLAKAEADRKAYQEKMPADREADKKRWPMTKKTY